MRTAVVVLISLLSIPGLAQQPGATPVFSEHSFVTALDLIVEVTDAKGSTPQDLQPGDFTVEENGQARPVIGVEYLRQARDEGSESRIRKIDPAASSWQILIWFDGTTTTTSSLRTAAREISKRADELAAMGSVTVVHFDLRAEMMVEATRDPAAIRQAADRVAKRGAGDRLSILRRRFLGEIDNAARGGLAAPTPLGPTGPEALASIQEETRLIALARTGLLTWMSRIPKQIPRLLLYLGDGFDLDPSAFYLQTIGAAGDAQIGDLMSYQLELQQRVEQENDRLARALAVGGWTALTVGGTGTMQFTATADTAARQRGRAQGAGVAPTVLFIAPDGPLLQLTAATGGERIAHAARLGAALEDIGRRIRVTYQVAREPDPAPRRVRVRVSRPGLTVKAPEWVSSTTPEAVAEGRAIDVLSGSRNPTGDVPLQPSLEMEPSQGGRPRGGTIGVLVDLSPLRDLLAQIDRTKLRVSVAVAVSGSPSQVFHHLVELERPASQRIAWSAPIEVPADTNMVAIVVEELATGAWGSARVPLDGTLESLDETIRNASVQSAAMNQPPAELEAEWLRDDEAAFAKAIAERKMVLAFHHDRGCKPCAGIIRESLAHPTIRRFLAQFVPLSTAVTDIAGTNTPYQDARFALYDPARRLHVYWPAVNDPTARVPRILTTGEVAELIQLAAAAAPHLIEAHGHFGEKRDLDGYFALAWGYRSAKEHARAAHAYRTAAQLARDQGDTARAQSAESLALLSAASTGEIDGALEGLRAIAARPESPLNEAEARLAIGQILKLRGDDKGASVELFEVLRLAPEDSEAWHLADALAGGRGSAAKRLVGGDRQAVRVVVRGKGPFSGPTSIETLVQDPTVDTVAFELDGSLRVNDASPPFETQLDLGPVPRRREVRVVARNRAGAVLGEDAMVLNERHDEFWIRLRPATGGRVAHLEVNAPADSPIEHVQFFVDDVLVSSPSEPPFMIDVAAGATIVSARARLNDGRTAEHAVLIGARGFSDSVEVHDVELYATVTGPDDQPLRGLDRAQFTILENGIPRRIAGFEFFERAPYTIGLAIDSSDSMKEQLPYVHQSVREFLIRVVADGSRAFLVDFDTAPKLASPTTTDLGALVGALERIRPDGSTALYDALIFGLLQLEGLEGKRALLVLTDGVDETSRYGIRESVRVARDSGATVYLVVLAERTLLDRIAGTHSELETIAIETGGRVWRIDRAADLAPVYQEIERELRNQYRLTFRTSPKTAPDDWREVRVSVEIPEASVRTISGFFAR